MMGDQSCLTGVEAGFPLAIGADDAIGGHVALGVEYAALVGALHIFIEERPDESAGAGLALQDGVPIVLHARAGAAVIEAVQHLGGEEDGIGGELLL